jgi:hypothetical protein
MMVSTYNLSIQEAKVEGSLEPRSSPKELIWEQSLFLTHTHTKKKKSIAMKR